MKDIMYIVIFLLAVKLLLKQVESLFPSSPMELSHWHLFFMAVCSAGFGYDKPEKIAKYFSGDKSFLPNELSYFWAQQNGCRVPLNNSLENESCKS